MRETVETFDEALGGLAPHLNAIDPNWRKRALRAGWPRNLNDEVRGGLAKWCRDHGDRLECAQRDALEIARSFYRDDARLADSSHLRSRATMRKIADLWGRYAKLIQIAAPGIESRVNPEGLLMLAYLEIALAEKLSEQGMTRGAITPWATLGSQWTSLCRHRDVGPLPQLSLDVIVGYLQGETAELGEAVVGMAYQGAWGKYFSARQIVESQSIDDGALMEQATQYVSDAAMQGRLAVRCRRRGASEYVQVPRLAWRRIRVAAERRADGGWRVLVIARPDQDVFGLENYVECDSWIVDAKEFQKEWPTKDIEADRVRRSLLEHPLAELIDARTRARLGD